MTRIIVPRVIWNEANSEHIKKHNVTKEEVSIGVRNAAYHTQTYKNRYLVVGRSNRRILSVVVKRHAPTAYLVVTARDASKKERRRLYEKEQNK